MIDKGIFDKIGIIEFNTYGDKSSNQEIDKFKNYINVNLSKNQQL